MYTVKLFYYENQYSEFKIKFYWVPNKILKNNLNYVKFHFITNKDIKYLWI